MTESQDESKDVKANAKIDEFRPKNIRPKTDGVFSRRNISITLCSIIVGIAIYTEVRHKYNFNDTAIVSNVDNIPKYWVYSAYNDVENENGLLKHVHLVLKRLAYKKVSNQTSWNLLWSHDYPFRALYPNLHKLEPHQLVNHFPGTGFITNKVDLATSNLKYIPKAFKLPSQSALYLEYISKNPSLMFLEKHNQHRGVFMKDISRIDVSGNESFVQEYVRKPFLVDGYKFDIGVYVVLTSVDPLRVYWYKGDVLFRYCPEKYYPFDPEDLDKYVIRDDYRPTWEVPSLIFPYTKLGLSMKDSFDLYVEMQGHDPKIIWDQITDAIREVFINKEHHIIEALKYYPSSTNFFEMMRFDLVLDDELKVHLLEANMSPNLSSAHYPPNQLLYEQILYNLFSITGVASHLRGNITRSDKIASNRMIAAQKNIAVWGRECSTICKHDCSQIHRICSTCTHCLSERMKQSLMRAHKEFLHKGDFKRLYPKEMKPNNEVNNSEGSTEANRIQNIWFQGKCNIDATWC